MPNRSRSIPNWDDYPERPLGDLDRAAFCCGDAAVDGYFTSGRICRDVDDFNSTAFVLTSPEGKIASFYTLSNAGIAREKFASEERKRDGYNYSSVSAILIGYLGVDQNFQGRQGFGSRTLKLALERCYRVSQDSGVSLIVVDVETKNEPAMNLYHQAEFKDLVIYQTGGGRYELLRLYLPMKRLAAALRLPV